MKVVTYETVTMTSLELVDFINAERAAAGHPVKLRHDHFMAKVPEVLGEAAPKFSGTAFYTNGTGAKVERQIYTFPKREACLMAMSYSYDIQAKVFDRMTELENKLREGGDKPTAIQSAKEFRALYGIARLIGLDKNVAAISANQAVIKMTGTNVLQLLGSVHLETVDHKLYLTPTEIGTKISASARDVNKMLEGAGIQEHSTGRWMPTTNGEKFARWFDTGKRHDDGTAVQQLKWSQDIMAMFD